MLPRCSDYSSNSNFSLSFFAWFPHTLHHTVIGWQAPNNNRRARRVWCDDQVHERRGGRLSVSHLRNLKNAFLIRKLKLFDFCWPLPHFNIVNNLLVETRRHDSPYIYFALWCCRENYFYCFMMLLLFFLLVRFVLLSWAPLVCLMTGSRNMCVVLCLCFSTYKKCVFASSWKFYVRWHQCLQDLSCKRIEREKRREYEKTWKIFCSFAHYCVPIWNRQQQWLGSDTFEWISQ